MGNIYDRISKSMIERCVKTFTYRFQWKYGIGPHTSVNVGDDVWMSRFLLIKVAEDFGVTVQFSPVSDWSNLKPFSADIEFSTDSLIESDRQK